MEAHVAILCRNGSLTVMSFGPRCPVLENMIDLREAEDWARQAIKDAGWIVADGEHYCPRHDPAMTGVMTTISNEYAEIAPGLRVRVPLEREGDTMRIELLRSEPIVG